MALIIALLLTITTHAATKPKPVEIFVPRDGADTSFQAEEAGKTFNEMRNVTNALCPRADCTIKMKNLICDWQSDAKIKSANCSYKNRFGITKKFSGPVAYQIASKVVEKTQMDPSGAAGARGFSAEKDLSCRSIGKGKKKPQYVCSIFASKKEEGRPAKLPRPSPGREDVETTMEHDNE